MSKNEWKVALYDPDTNESTYLKPVKDIQESLSKILDTLDVRRITITMSDRTRIQLDSKGQNVDVYI